MERQIRHLLDEVAVQARYLALQVLHAGDKSLDCATLRMERWVPAREVVLDQLVQISLEVLIGDFLPRPEVEPRLIEPAAEPLPVLGDEPRHQAARHDGADEEHPVKQSSYE